MFEKNITKVLDTNIQLFNYRIDLEYDHLRRKNHHNIKFSARDDFKLDSFDNMRIIENHLRKIIKLHYFRKVIFCDIFPEGDEWGNDDALDVWHYRLREALKMKSIKRVDKELRVFFF